MSHLQSSFLTVSRFLLLPFSLPFSFSEGRGEKGNGCHRRYAHGDRVLMLTM